MTGHARSPMSLCFDRLRRRPCEALSLRLKRSTSCLEKAPSTCSCGRAGCAVAWGRFGRPRREKPLCQKLEKPSSDHSLASGTPKLPPGGPNSTAVSRQRARDPHAPGAYTRVHPRLIRQVRDRPSHSTSRPSHPRPHSMLPRTLSPSSSPGAVGM